MSNKDLIHALFLILNIFVYICCLLIWNTPSISLIIKMSTLLSNTLFSLFILTIFGLKKIKIFTALSGF